jgi:hypothetical protein
MGLDVKIYKGVKPATEKNYKFVPHVLEESWKDRIKNLTEPYYTGTDLGNFISYPCSTHNEFRDSLCAIVTGERYVWRGRDLSKQTPFYEFFEFADNDGCIDWETAAKLHHDFILYESKARENLNIAQFDYYKTWVKIFKVASKENSVIIYH